jgi:hypothetical protein
LGLPDAAIRPLTVVTGRWGWSSRLGMKSRGIQQGPCTAPG